MLKLEKKLEQQLKPETKKYLYENPTGRTKKTEGIFKDRPELRRVCGICNHLFRKGDLSKVISRKCMVISHGMFERFNLTMKVCMSCLEECFTKGDE